MPSQTKYLKVKVGNLDFTKIEIIFSPMKNTLEMKRKATNCEKVLTKYLSENGLYPENRNNS